MAEPLTVNADDQKPAVIKLRYVADQSCAWGLVAGSNGAAIWVDKSFDGGSTWEGPLGRRTIQSGNGTTYTAAYRVGDGVSLRACGTGVHGDSTPGQISCTNWYTIDQPSAPLSRTSTEEGVLLPDASRWNPGKRLYVALGDSYSAGEGSPAPPIGESSPSGFLAATDIDDNKCHRSAAAYPVQVWQTLGPDWSIDFAACSGAKSTDYVSAQYDLAPAQRSVLYGRMADLVTLTLGGNDIGFSAIGTACIVEPDGCSFGSDVIDNALSGVEPNLTALLADVGEHVRANGQIIAIGYPRPFPADPPGGCQSGAARLISRSNMIYVNNLVDRLNAAIKNAASANLVSYVDVADIYSGNGADGVRHDFCVNNGAQRWVNRIIESNLVYSLHPKDQAHATIARRVEDCVANRDHCLAA